MAMNIGQLALVNGYWTLGSARVLGHGYWNAGYWAMELMVLVILVRCNICPKYDSIIAPTAVRGATGAVAVLDLRS